MRHGRSGAGVLVGLAAAATALGAATTTAPTARADDLSQIIADVEADFAYGHTAFTTASADLSGNELLPALTSFLNGVDDDSLSAPNTVLIETTQALSNEALSPIAGGWSLLDPTSYADGVSAAQYVIGEGDDYLALALTAAASGDYGMPAYESLFGLDFLTVAPLEELLFGVAASF